MSINGAKTTDFTVYNLDLESFRIYIIGVQIRGRVIVWRTPIWLRQSRSLLGKHPDCSPNTIQPFWTLRDRIVLLANGKRIWESIQETSVANLHTAGSAVAFVNPERKYTL